MSKRMGKAHAAKFENSPRLQRAARYLADGKWRSTRRISRNANVMAVNSVMYELKVNGFWYEQEKRSNGYHYYRIVSIPPHFDEIIKQAA